MAEEPEGVKTGPTEAYWIERTFRSHFEDPELRAIDIMCQVVGDSHLANVQRWRIMDYVQERFKRPIPGDEHGV